MNPAYLKTSRHLQDYLSGVKKLQPFYSQSLRPDWQEIAAEVSKAFKQKEIVTELIAQNQQSADPEMQKNCKLLKKDNTVIVITGQQLGLMQSPLYIIYKTLSTLWLTDKLNKEDNGYQFVPVFWLEGEDHDFEEVKSLTVHGMSGGLKTIALDEDTAEQGMSLNSRSLSKDIEFVLKELKETLDYLRTQRNLRARKIIDKLNELNVPVTMEELKTHSALIEMALLKKGNRMSIQRVTEKEWKYITSLRKLINL